MNAEPKLTGGVLIHLPRDEAKSFFSMKGDDAVLEFVNQSLGTGVVLNTDSAWPRIAKALGDEPPLAWCFVGGRPMFQGDSHQIVLVRPDMVAHVATKLIEMTADQMTEFAGDDAPTLQAVRDHYDAAAKSGCAMIFAVENES